MHDVLTVPAALALSLGLGVFLGLAFEEHHAEDQVRRPGGIRTFPMLALAGAVLWLIEPAHGTALREDASLAGFYLVALGFGGRRAWRPAGTLYALSAATWAERSRWRPDLDRRAAAAHIARSGHRRTTRTEQASGDGRGPA